MKRLISMILCLSMLFSMAACDTAERVPINENNKQPVQESTVDQKKEETPEKIEEKQEEETNQEEWPEGAVGYMDISINPSIRLYFNFEKVIINVRFLNEDAQEA